MAALDLTSYAAMLKKMYPQSRVDAMFFKRFPLLAFLEKTQAPGPGSSIDVTVEWGSVNNRSATYATMKAGTATLKSSRFSINVSDNFNRGVVDHKTLLSSKTNVQAFANAMDRTVKGVFNAMKRDIGHNLYRTSTGAFGNISSVGSGSLVFTKRGDMRHLEPDMILQASANADLSSPRAGALTILTVDRATGTVTYSGTDTGWTAGDYVVVSGDIGLKFKGLADWLPSGSGRASSLASSFFGVTRNLDAVRLGGIYYDGSALPTEEALLMTSARLFEEEAETDLILMNATDYANLQRELGARAVMSNIVGTEAKIGFSGIKIVGMVGNSTIIPDADCPSGKVYMLDTSTWKLACLGGNVIGTWNEDGLQSLRDATNGLEIIAYSYIQPYTEAPGKNAVVDLPTNLAT